MKKQTALTIALIALSAASTAFAETRCERIENAQYENRNDGEIHVKPDSKLLLSASFNDGYWTEYSTARSCVILSGGHVAITTRKKGTTHCKWKKLAPSKAQAVNDLTEKVKAIPVSTGEYGVCDDVLYSLALREGNSMSALDWVEDCGDRKLREGADAVALRTSLLKTCESTKYYEDYSSKPDDEEETEAATPGSR